jgi:hypothetical protein
MKEFDFTEIEVEVEDGFYDKNSLTLPDFVVAYQIKDKNDNSSDGIFDTYYSNFRQQFFPIEKAKSKARAMKSVYPKKEIVVVAIGHDGQKVICFTSM